MSHVPLVRGWWPMPFSLLAHAIQPVSLLAIKEIDTRRLVAHAMAYSFSCGLAGPGWPGLGEQVMAYSFGPGRTGPGRAGPGWVGGLEGARACGQWLGQGLLELDECRVASRCS